MQYHVAKNGEKSGFFADDESAVIGRLSHGSPPCAVFAIYSFP